MAIIFRDIMILLGYVNYYFLLSSIPGNNVSSLSKIANGLAFGIWISITWLDIISISRED